MKKRQRKYDELVSRVLFIELAIVLIALGGAIYFFEKPLPHVGAVLFCLFFVISGFVSLFFGFFSSQKKIIKYAEKTGDSEFTLLLVILAFAIASLITKFGHKRKKRGTE